MLTMGGYNGGDTLEENIQIQTQVLEKHEAKDILSQLDDSVTIRVNDKQGNSLGEHNITNILLYGIEQILIETSSDLSIINGEIISGEIIAYIKKDKIISPNNKIIENGLDLSQHLDTVVEVSGMKLKIADIINMPGLTYSLDKNNTLQVRHSTAQQVAELINK